MKAVMMLTMMSAVTMVLVRANQDHANDKHVKRLREDVKQLTETVNSLVARPKNQGSSFVRWGRKTCPSTSSTVYSGLVGAKHYTSKGHGTNILCLTKSPRMSNKVSSTGYAYLWGAEYDGIPNHFSHDAPCSVCLAPQSTTIMVPGTDLCPSGWTSQYTGNLVASQVDHYATEYICLDGSPEDEHSGRHNHKGWTIFYVRAVCGSLSCHPYIHNKVFTCAVCSK